MAEALAGHYALITGGGSGIGLACAQHLLQDGATVTLLDMDTDEEVTYALVGEDEADADEGRINIKSPIARAMMGKVEGDDVLVRLPKGDREFEVVSIEYKAIQ